MLSGILLAPLSALAQRYGDDELALQHTRRAIEAAPEASDPFDVYRLGRGRDADQRWDTFRTSLDQEP